MHIVVPLTLGWLLASAVPATAATAVAPDGSRLAEAAGGGLPASARESPACDGSARAARAILAAADPERAAGAVVLQTARDPTLAEEVRCPCLGQLASTVVAARPQTAAALAQALDGAAPRCLLTGVREMQRELVRLAPDGTGRPFPRFPGTHAADNGASGQACWQAACGTIEPASHGPARFPPGSDAACAPAKAGSAGTAPDVEAGHGRSNPCGITDNVDGVRATAGPISVASVHRGEYLLDLISRVLSVFRQLLA